MPQFCSNVRAGSISAGALAFNSPHCRHVPSCAHMPMCPAAVLTSVDCCLSRVSVSCSQNSRTEPKSSPGTPGTALTGVITSHKLSLLHNSPRLPSLCLGLARSSSYWRWMERVCGTTHGLSPPAPFIPFCLLYIKVPKPGQARHRDFR